MAKKKQKKIPKAPETVKTITSERLAFMQGQAFTTIIQSLQQIKQAEAVVNEVRIELELRAGSNKKV